MNDRACRMDDPGRVSRQAIPGRAARGVAPYTPCFVEGAVIATDRGAVAIEELRVGDRVLTRDSGYQPIRWIGARHFDEETLARYTELQPVVIGEGAFGPGVPARDLHVSPQHRVLLSGAVSLDLSGESESLISAVDLVGQPGVERSDATCATYYHLLFDAHEIVLSDGCWTESFLIDAAALSGLHTAQAREIMMIFPELGNARGLDRFAPARVCITRETSRVSQIAA